MSHESDLKKQIDRWQKRRHRLRIQLLCGPDLDPPITPERETNLRTDIAECDRWLDDMTQRSGA